MKKSSNALRNMGQRVVNPSYHRLRAPRIAPPAHAEQGTKSNGEHHHFHSWPSRSSDVTTVLVVSRQERYACRALSLSPVIIAF